MEFLSIHILLTAVWLVFILQYFSCPVFITVSILVNKLDNCDKLIKDIYNLYLFGEGSITALPKHMFKSDSKFVDMCVQTDSCLIGALSATKSDLENLKAELLNKISYLKQDIISETVKSPPSDSNHVSLPSVQS